MNTRFKDIFAGKVVNKRLTFNTGMDEFPRYVLEYLTDNYCEEKDFEEDFELEIASIEEKIILKNEEVDLVIIIPDSEGSAAELGVFSQDPLIRPKLRILVPHQYHPLYSGGDSYLSSLYLELMSVHGHIYPIDPLRELHPDGVAVASMMMRSYRLNVVAGLLSG